MELECKPCNKKFSGPAPYQQHIESARHLKIVASSGLSSTESSQQSSVASRPVNLYNPLKCDVCNISFDSIMHFQSHCLTLQHANNVRAQHSATIDTDTDIEIVSSSTLNGNGVKDAKILAIDESDSILPLNSNCKTFYKECEICDKQFSGHEPYQQHMASAVHKRKVGQQLMSGQNRQGFSCEACKMVFSGIIPYTQHQESEGHRKKMLLQPRKEECGSNNDKVCNPYIAAPDPNIQSSNSLVDVMDQQRPWFCKICQIQCSGMIPFQDHLKGITHIKKSRMAAFLGSYTNDISIVSPKVNETSHQKMETDSILPEEGLQLLEKADVNVKIFYEDEKIDFDATYEDNSKIDWIQNIGTVTDEDDSISLKDDKEIDLIDLTSN